MREQITPAIEDYLKAIYALASEHGRATTGEIARRMGVDPASVTGMVQKLAATDPPLVEYRKHRGVELTEQGETVALEVLRHHRLLELFLQETLGYSWDEVHREADRLEHVISEEMEERIAQALGDPSHDQHGDPIPTRDFRLPAHYTLPLSALRPGQQAVVRRVDAADPAFLRHLQALCLTPGAVVTVLDHSPFDGNLSLAVAGCEEPVVLGPRVTEKIFVEEQAAD